jgi:two-component system NtrC family sensor kinase
MKITFPVLRLRTGHRSIRRYLVAIFCVIVSVELLVLIVVSKTIEKTLMSYVIQDSRVMTQGVSAIIQGFLDESLGMVREIGRDAGSRDGIGTGQLDALISGNLRVNPSIERLMLIDRKGTVRGVYPFDENLYLIDLSSADYFNHTSESDEPYWSDTFISPISGEPTVIVAKRTGKYIAAGFINLARLEERIQALQKGSRVNISVLDANGTYIIDSDREKVISRMVDPDIKAIRQSGGDAVSTISMENGVVIDETLVRLRPVNWIVEVHYHRDELLRPVNRIMRIVWFGLITLFTLTIVLGYFIVRGITRSINSFVGLSQQISVGNYESLGTIVAYKEFTALSENLNIMRKRIEERERDLQMSEVKFRTIVDTIPVAIGIHDLNDQIIYCNPSFTALFGYTLNDMTNINEWMRRAFPDTEYRALVYELYYSDIMRCMNNAPASREYIMTCADGSIKYIIMTTTIYHDQVFDVFNDITARKEAEKEIIILNRDLENRIAERTSQLEQANCALGNMNEALKLTNEELERTLARLKDAQEHMVQTEKLSALGQVAAGIAHEINTPLGAIISANDHLMRGLPKMGITFYDLYRKLKPDEHGFFMELMRRSLNERKEYTSRDQRALKMGMRKHLTEAGISEPEKIADAFADLGIYEDIDRYMKLLARDGVLDILHLTYHVSSLNLSTRIIEQAAQKAAKVVATLKTFLHVSVYEEPVLEDVSSGIEMVLALYYSSMKNSVQLVKRFDPVPKISCYPERLHQVWTNLINNALHAIDFNGTLEIDIELAGEEISVSVIDDGPGIPEAIRDKIFQPFFTTKKTGEGTGLGLDIALKIVDFHGGRIKYESRPGRTVFTVFLKPAI